MDRPILLITIDCLRTDHVGAYGYEKDTTPNIDEFAARDDTVRLHGFANSPGTRWAFQLLHTGIWPTFIEGHGIPDGIPTLPGKLGNEGYETGAFAFNGNLTRAYDYHKYYDCFKGVEYFTNSEDSVVTAGKTVANRMPDRISQLISSVYNRVYLPAKSISEETPISPSDTEVVDEALAWVAERQRADEPYFGLVHLMDAHTPYVHKDKHLQAVNADSSLKSIYNPNKSGNLNEPEFRERALQAYDSAARSADEQVGRLLDQVSEDTIVVVTADHGEDFGEHVGFHDPSAYSSMVHVPLVVRIPGVEKDIVDERVQHLDLPPSLLRSVGITPPEMWEGTAIQSLVQGEPRDMYFGIRGTEFGLGILSGDWKLVKDHSTDESRLYEVDYPHPDSGPINDRPDLKDDLESKLSEYVNRTFNLQFEATASWDTEEGRDHLSESVEENLEELGDLE